MKNIFSNFFRCFIPVLVLWIAGIQIAEARVLMVSVGINRYPQRGVTPLRLAENDARDFASLMSSDKDADIRLVLGQNATKATVINQLKQIAASAKPGDVLCLFFSGHGLKGGMALTDTKSYDTLLSYKEISRIFKSSKAQTKLIFADTCHSGSMRLGKKNATAEDINKLKSQDIILFLSSRGNESSMEAGYGMKNGLFTNYVLSGMTGSADGNRDGNVTAKELFDYVSRQVKTATRNRQHPVMWGKFDADKVLTTVKR